jgi:hypothetical protein
MSTRPRGRQRVATALTRAAFALSLCCGLIATFSASPAWSDDPGGDPATQVPAGQPAGVLNPAATPASSTGIARWFNPETAPFLPIPLIGVDPDSGTTLGLLPVRLVTDDNHDIRRIIAPDILYNPFFGYGGHARVYDYPSEDTQWSVVAGINERVQRQFDAEYQTGRLREQRWSINGSLVYSHDGTPRFFGIGNRSPGIAETDYTQQQELMQIQVGLNLSHAWQLLYTGRVQVVDVLPGTLEGIASLESRFGHILGVGTNKQVLNRVSIGYDTRDNLTAPSHGMEWVAYLGAAARNGILNDSMYSEVGIDGRDFWLMLPNTILATHVSLRYLPTAHQVPFWALSSLGGDQSAIGGDQPLRGYGPGRYYDRDSFSASAEVRQRIATINAVSSHVELELTPFVDIGRVFSQTGTFPLSQLHSVAGIGVRGLARPFVVGYVDFGYGSEGLAVFTGINYPF